MKVVADSDEVFCKALNLAKANGKVIYVFPEIRKFAAHLPRKAVNELSATPGISIGEAVVEALDEKLSFTCKYHGAVLTWNLDMINVPIVHEEYRLNGSRVYIAVLDTGLKSQ